MDVFISWSGDRSKKAAEALHHWLPKVINAVQPWLSASDIDKGARWAADVATRLQVARVGILCVTPGNLHSDWILFEAGALSKTLENTYVCPLLFGLDPSDVKGPLAQFQATRAAKDEMFRLLETVNAAVGESALPEGHLKEAFEVWWPKLEAQLKNLPEEDSVRPQRPERELLEEILALVRSQVRPEAEVLKASPRKRLADAILNAARSLGPVTSGRIGSNSDSLTCTFEFADGRVGEAKIPYDTPEANAVDALQTHFVMRPKALSRGDIGRTRRADQANDESSC